MASQKSIKKKPTRRQHARMTISDVALRARVSPMTVSRVINDEDNVRPSTREQVQAAIKALGYAPNKAARSLASANQIQIGLLYNNPNSAYLSELLLGGLEEAKSSDVQLVVVECNLSSDPEASAHKLVASGIDGIILPPPLSDSRKILNVVRSTDTPTVVIATTRTQDNVASVSIDDYLAALVMTRHIISLGHKRIGIIIGNPDQLASGRRLHGYRDALTEAGLEVADELEQPGLFTYQSGRVAAEKLLSLKQPPTAIFSSNDDMAAATVNTAHRMGLDVPGDLTVCGFDDTSMATRIWPELTTIHQPIRDMSRAAIELLVRKIKARRAGEDLENSNLVLEFFPVWRQSDGVPRPGRSRKTRTKKR